MIKIDVAKAFSKTPYGRYKTDGDFSAERFRDEVLKPVIQQNPGENIEIDFSNVAFGMGSSFLEEIFGGLVRLGYTAKELKHIKLIDKTGLYQSQMKFFIAKELEKQNKNVL